MTADPPVVEVRFDAGPGVGLGHAVRCCALVEALRLRGVVVRVVGPRAPDWLEARLRPAADVAGPGSVVVVDGYQLGEQVARAATTGARVVVIDDNRELPVEQASLVVNVNLHASRALYHGLDRRRLLLGPRYALLRTEVTSLERTPADPHGGTVLVAFGGSDPARLLLPTVRHLMRSGGLLVIVALPDDHPDATELRSLGPHVRVAQPDLLDGFARADVAVIGAGGTMWEAAHLGVPAVAVVVADNQLDGARAADERGLVVAVDARSDAVPVNPAVDSVINNVSLRSAMGAVGPALFDGRGATRVAAAIGQLLP